MIRVAINGFGRIGRQVLQAGIDNKNIEWVAINDLTPVDNLAYLLKYDSVYGRFPGTVEHTDNSITINGQKIQVFSQRDPAQLPWKDLNVDVVVESTGFFTKRDGAQLHLSAGAKKVLISAPAKEPDFSIVCGVNDKDLKTSHKIVSNCSCTTNAIATLVKILHDNHKIKRGMLVTAHAYTASQGLVDGPNKKDYRRGRHAAVNIVPTTTGAAKTVFEVIPELKGKLDGYAWRVPVPVGSIVSLIAEVEKPTTVEEINHTFENASKKLKGIVGYAHDPLVLQDIVKDSRSTIYDSHSTRVVDKTMVNISGWYDNEWGFSHRMVEVIEMMGKK